MVNLLINFFIRFKKCCAQNTVPKIEEEFVVFIFLTISCTYFQPPKLGCDIS